jgi:hypothetical protein
MGKRPEPRLKTPSRVLIPAAIHIVSPNDTDPVYPGFFSAYGTAEQAGQVIGIVTYRDGTVVSVGHTLAEPPNWVIYFRDLPEKEDLTLWVFESPRMGRSCIPLYATVDFSTGSKSSWGNVSITSPGSNTKVSPTFSACGTTDQAGNVVANFDGHDGTYTGTVLQGPPNWVVQFTNTNLSTGNYKYTLNVIIKGVADTHGGITVS